MNPAFIQGIGPLELVVVLVIVLLVFGPKRLPAVARSARVGFRELKASFAGRGDADARPVVGRSSLAHPGEPPAAPSATITPDERPLKGEVGTERR